MKRQINILYGIAFAVLFATVSVGNTWAQSYVSVPVEISKEKVRIDDKICYSHVVLERQTLYSISKAYGVSIEDIYKFNPAIKETGLKKNSILIIPSNEATKSTPRSVRKDTTTKVKNASVPQSASEPETYKPQRIHIAKWYEDLDVIAELYGVTAADIMSANNLAGRKLSRRQKLIIPYPGENLSKVHPEDTTAKVKEVPQKELALTFSPDTVSAVAYTPKKHVNATLILPLTDSDGKANRNNIDFYCGSLLAIHDMAENGIGCNLNVYDIMDSKSQLSIESLTGSDFIIGPISIADLTRMMNIAPDAKAVISPLDPRTEKIVAGHKNMIQAPTPHYIQYEDVIKWMQEDYRDGDRIVMITEKGARQSNMTSLMKTVLDSSALAYNQFSYSILEGRDVVEPLTALMTTEGTNRILISSESEAFVNDVVRNLNLLIYNNLDIVLYSPSKIRGFETIEVENFHNTSMRVSTAYYIDYGSPQVQKFILRYRALFNTEPTQFAFQGYDLMKYFIDMASCHGVDWKSVLTDKPQEMLQSTFRFVNTPGGGFINNGVRRIIYGAGYEVNRVR